MRKKRKRSRLPRQLSPKGIERDYARALVKHVRGLKEELRPLMLELPALLKEEKAERERFDIGGARRIQRLVAAIALRMSVSNAALESLAARFAKRTKAHQEIQFAKQVGESFFLPSRGVAQAVEGFVAENAALIKDLPRKALADVEGILQRAVTGGGNARDAAREIKVRLAISENRAKLIARDQIHKLNGAVNRARQTSTGVTHFRWRTMGDDRVRDSHEALEGQVFSWKTGSPEGFPGQPINCRCHAEPVL